MTGSDHSKTVLICALTVMMLFGGRAYAQDFRTGAGLPNNYQEVRNWGTLPNGRIWGSVGGLATGPDGSIWAFDRCGANGCQGSNAAPIVRLDPKTGKTLITFGAGMFATPHGLYVDPEGNVWATDITAGRDGKTGSVAMKFSPDGKLLMTLGKPGVAGNPPEALTAPMNVVTAPNGDIFVSEGHNAMVGRISKFTKDGKFIKSIGTYGTPAAPGKFSAPHALTIFQNRLYVGDRGNNRVAVLDLEGNFLDSFPQFYRASGLKVDKNGVMYAVCGEDKDNQGAGGDVLPGWSKGVRIGNAKDGKVTGFIPPHSCDCYPGYKCSCETRAVDQRRPANITQASGETMTVDLDGNLYVAEVTTGGITKYIKKK